MFLRIVKERKREEKRSMELIFLRFLFNCTRARSRETYDNGGTGEGACY